MAGLEEVSRILARIDGRGYKAYRDLRGSYRAQDLTLFVDHVQGDPFAAPSKVRIRVPRRVAGDLSATPVRRVALEDFLARRVARAIRHRDVRIDAGGQEVLERSAARVTGDWLEARLEVGLPAAGRRIRGREAEAILCGELPRLARELASAGEEPRPFVECVENQEAIRETLAERGLLAFVGEGAVLPRASGVSDRPLADAVPFRTPQPLAVELDVPNPPHRVRGMGVPRGVTLIVGGGYHGKSTLLRALERGVYPHVPEDGREWVVTDPGALKVRAEDGRRVERVDIGAFIGDLPGGRSTRAFRSDDASGSTSQAASIVEGLEAGATALLLDEDTCATNFMVRDARMQELVAKRDEPITPFVDRVRELYERLGISTVLVMGGSGDYFEAADTVVAMRAYEPEVVTERAREIARRHATGRRREAPAPMEPPTPRTPDPGSLDASRGRREVKIDAKTLWEVGFGRERVDLRGVDQLVDRSQTRAVGQALYALRERFAGRPLPEALDGLESLLDAEGVDVLDPFRRGEGDGRHPGNLARPRRLEVAAALNRLRSLRVQSTS